MTEEQHQPKSERIQARVSQEVWGKFLAIQEHFGGISPALAVSKAIEALHAEIADSPTKGSVVGGFRLTSTQEPGATCANCNGEYQGGETPSHALLIDDGKYCRVLAPVCATCAA